MWAAVCGGTPSVSAMKRYTDAVKSVAARFPFRKLSATTLSVGSTETTPCETVKSGTVSVSGTAIGSFLGATRRIVCLSRWEAEMTRGDTLYCLERLLRRDFFRVSRLAVLLGITEQEVEDALVELGKTVPLACFSGCYIVDDGGE